MSEGKKSFEDFLVWYNNKDFVPILKAVQKRIDFYHQNEIDMVEWGITLPSLANICLHKSTDSKSYPFTESDKDLLEKIREDMVDSLVPPLSLHAKLWFTKLLSANQQTFASQLSA